jgi:hypothetical protein
MTTLAMMKALRDRVFSASSVPGIIFSDNMKCIVSEEFQIVLFHAGN